MARESRYRKKGEDSYGQRTYRDGYMGSGHLVLGRWMIGVEAGSRLAPQIRKGCIRSPWGKVHRDWVVGPQNRRVQAHGQTAAV